MLRPRRIGEGQHAARRADLDHVGAVFDGVPHRLADLVHAVGHAIGDPRLMAEGAGAIPFEVVAMTARDAERRPRAENAGARNPAAADRVAQRDVVEMARPDDADRREPGLERLVRVRRPEERELAR